MLTACITLLVACTPLAPRDPEPETHAAPSGADHWTQLQALRTDNWFRVLNNGHDALEWRVRAIDSAVERIDVQTFIWELDSVGSLLRQRILRAAQRGVHVRILVDDSFTARADAALLSIDQHPGVDLRIYNPYRRRANHSALRTALNLGEFWRLDHRMHNKVMLVDGRAALMGGRNLAEHYFGYHESLNFRDLELLAGGPVVEQLATEFDTYWNSPWSFPANEILPRTDAAPDSPRELRLEAGPAPESAEQRQAAWLDAARTGLPGSARLLMDLPPAADPDATPDSAALVGRELLALIESAQRELWLISAYLVPTDTLEQAVQRARNRGVAVRVLTNSIRSNNHLSAHAAYANHLQNLLRMGVEVHEVRADAPERDRYMLSPVDDKSLCLHAKLILVDDDRAYVGSSNLDPRSLRINTEMGLILHSPALNAELRRVLAPDFAQANAWSVTLNDSGDLNWRSGELVLPHSPGHPLMRLEDWFLGVLPIEAEM